MSRALVERAQRGDRDAYEQLARGAARRLFLVAQRILRDTDQAEDAVQQTLVDIWRDLPSLRDPDRFDAWTYRIVVRHSRAETRRHRRLGVTIVDLSDAIGAGPGEPSEDVALRDQLDRAFRSLSHDHRVVVVLHHYLGLPLGEVAEILDIPYGTVGSRLHHAMRSMRATIDAAERTTVRGGQPA
jgi:RNA polymerase sigma-70 factor (ECF subfamily)